MTNTEKGGNTTLLMEDAPPLITEGVDPRDVHVVCLSAKSATSLMHNAERLLSYLSAHPSTRLCDLSYTTTARRVHHNFRRSFVGSSITAIKSSLESFLASGTKPTRVPPPPVAFTFTGQGSHYQSMGKLLFETVPSFQADLKRMDQIARGLGFPSFLSIITEAEGSPSPAAGPVQTQLALCSLEIALSKLWLSYGVKPSVLLGHSLGEYATLHCAGVLSLSDTLFLVGSRAQIMIEECTPGTHAMLAIKLSAAQVSESLTGGCEISCFNSMSETVAAGTDADITTLAASLEAKGVRATKLRVPFAFHSAQVDAILPRFEAVAKTVTYNAPRMSVASSVTGELIAAGQEGVFDAKYLAAHARQPVRFIGAVEAATTLLTALPAGHAAAWVEIGPHPVCVRMVKAATTLGSLQKRTDDWTSITGTMASLYAAGVNLDWSEVARPFEMAVKLLRLPSYAFDEKNYWLQYSGDWALTKGSKKVEEKVERQEEKVISTFSTSSLHKVVAQDWKKGEVIFVSNLAEPKLAASVSGHIVHGNPLVPSSLYADMALTAASYFHTSTNPDTPVPGMGCGKMEVFAPMVARNDGNPQELQITANGSVEQGFITLKFTALSPKKELATCEVRYGNSESWLQEWESVAYLVQSRMDSMAKAADEDAGVDRFQRKMAYRLFQTMVTYAPQYQGLQTVLLDSHALEASAKVKLQYGEKDGNFMFSPYAIDSIGHLSGFVVNCAGDEENAYLSHGWDNLRVTKPFAMGGEYKTYVRMRSVGPKMVGGDVYVFESGKVVACFGGLKFMAIKKSVMERLLPQRPGAAGAAKPAAAGAAAKSAGAARYVLTFSPSNSGTLTAYSPAPRAAAPAPKPARAAAPQTPAVLEKILAILIEEVGCTAADLSDTTTFEEIGVDSLLSLSILGRLRETLSSIEFPANLFLDHPTIKDLKAFVASVAPASSAPAAQAADHDDSSSASVDGDGSSTPSSSSTATTEPPSRSDEIVELFRETIAAEVGIEPAELTPGTELAELGVDSLMSLSILGILREKTEIDLPGSFFQDNATFGDIIAYLAPSPAIPTAKASKPTPNPAEMPTITLPLPKSQPISSLLQGQPSPNQPSLFLLPDGSGSAAVYAKIPKTGRAIFGMNSPFLSQPTTFTHTMQEICAMWVKEIRNRQPRGPYLLGGWSFGGMAAYEVARQLLEAGEKVQGIILIDSPSPLALPPLPLSMIKFIASTGLFGDVSKGIPQWLVDHFAAAVTALMNWTPDQRAVGQRPRAITIWAKHGVCGAGTGLKRPVLPIEDQNGTVEWLLEDRKEFGPNGWEHLCDVVGSSSTPGNHFSMVKPGQVSTR